MSLDELRALDAALARYLFGYVVEQRRNARTGALDYVCRRAGQAWQPVAPYSNASSILSLVVQFKLK